MMSDDTKVPITAADLATLLVRAKQTGTIDRWADLALMWVESADARIKLLSVGNTLAPTPVLTFDQIGDMCVAHAAAQQEGAEEDLTGIIDDHDKICELLQTGSITVMIDGKYIVVSLRFEEGEAPNAG